MTISPNGENKIAFTPETLAARWQCSPQHIRDLINKNQLKSFRVGRLYRIPYNSVMEFECPTISDKSYSVESGMQSGTMEKRQNAEAYAPQIVMRPHAV